MTVHLKEGNDPSSSIDSIFIFLLALSIIGFILAVKRVVDARRKAKQDEDREIAGY
jgi:hypothetical protein